MAHPSAAYAQYSSGYQPGGMVFYQPLVQNLQPQFYVASQPLFVPQQQQFFYQPNFFDPFNPSPVAQPAQSQWVELGEVVQQKPTSGPLPAPKPKADDLKRCSNCGNYYNESKASQCAYHPGKYRSAYSSLSYGPGFNVWSCCKKADSDAAGCRIGQHAEDMLATKKLSDYQKLVNALRPDHAASQQQQQHQHQQTSSAAIDTLVDFSFTGQSVPTSSTEKLYPTIHNDDFNPRAPVSQAHNASPSSSSKVTTASRTGGIDLPGKAGPVPLHITPEQLEGVPDGFIKHFVNKNDTLIGISMRYGITKVQLIRANQGLAHDNLYAFYDVKIPIDRENITIEKKEETEEDRQRERNKSIARFRRSQNVGEAEARFYLSENEFDVSKAIKERQADVEFERKYAQKHHDLPIAEKYVSPRKPFF